MRTVAIVAAVGARRSFGLCLFALGGGLITLVCIAASVAAIGFNSSVRLLTCFHHVLREIE